MEREGPRSREDARVTRGVRTRGGKTFGVLHGIYEVAVRNIRGISEWLAAYASRRSESMFFRDACLTCR